MPHETVPAGECPSCHGANLTCKYNLFESGDLRIDSWEHKCPDCGKRETTAFRSDDEDEVAENPDQCPYCGRQGKL